ncbi:hypothetical protein [Flavobacterium sp. HTF]|uniref:hypothetical protein n=1 Tax=Flavobacterium sp. HTF TaxID=2170732 RepID=UPI000D5E3A69|nr:hypothetical protein [Flavobacterium sp. HTF]PWB24163.1 hypothetical protein DCO46_12625 [Flavobacterium sp. HTF]
MDFYTILQVLIVSIAATSAMTLFSYAISAAFRELYKEPVLLTFLLTQMKLELSAQTKKTIAWLIHYIIGLLFVVGYHLLWIYNILELSVLNAFLLGAVCGIIGILGWVIMFKIARYKPAIDFKGYYIQLFFAHVVFGLVAAATYYLSITILLLTNTYVII